MSPSQKTLDAAAEKRVAEMVNAKTRTRSRAEVVAWLRDAINQSAIDRPLEDTIDTYSAIARGDTA